MKKIYEEPSFDLTKIHFGQIMEGDDYGLIPTSQPGGGAGGGDAGGVD